MRVFKSSYKDRKGQTTKTNNWYVEFRDHNEDTRRIPAFASKGASEEFGRNIDRLVAYHKATGGQSDPALQKWLLGIPNKARDVLVRIGLVASERVAAKKPLAEHIADFDTALRAKGSSDRHVDLVVARVKRVADECGFRYWSEISASKTYAFLDRLKNPPKKNGVPASGDEPKVRGIGAQTFNFYLQSMKHFCRWMVKDRRASESPLAHLEPLNTKVDRRHDRRALSADELRRLIDVARNGPEMFGHDHEGIITWRMSGMERAVLYRLAAESGLRAGELRSLTASSLDLDADLPTVTVKAAYSKRRREDSLPILPSTASMLREYVMEMEPGTPLFNMPRRESLVRMLRNDLAVAQIPYRDASNRVADFHALRHTFITNLAQGGIHPKTAQSLARHSTITLTMDRYSHTYREDDAAALNVLPDLSNPEPRPLKATGTEGPRPSEDVSASCLAQTERFGKTAGDSERLDGSFGVHPGTHENGSDRAISARNKGFGGPGRGPHRSDFKSGAINRSATPPGVWSVARLCVHATRPQWWTGQAPESNPLLRTDGPSRIGRLRHVYCPDATDRFTFSR